VGGLGAAEVLPRDADLAAIEPVDGVFDAVPLGPAASTAALRDGGTAVFTRPPGPGGAESERDLRLESFLVSPDATGLRALAERLAAGELRTRVARTLPLEKAAEGHRLAEAGGLHGKVVLTA
jgi:NADPH2:quinone reductase